MTLVRGYERQQDGRVFHFAYERFNVNAADTVRYLRSTAQLTFRRFVVFRFDK